MPNLRAAGGGASAKAGDFGGASRGSGERLGGFGRLVKFERDGLMVVIDGRDAPDRGAAHGVLAEQRVVLPRDDDIEAIAGAEGAGAVHAEEHAAVGDIAGFAGSEEEHAPIADFAGAHEGSALVAAAFCRGVVLHLAVLADPVGAVGIGRVVVRIGHSGARVGDKRRIVQKSELGLRVDNRGVTIGTTKEALGARGIPGDAEPSAPPDVSVIIPTKGRPAALRTCLERLAGQRFAGGVFETIVVFDGPDEASEEVAAGFGGRLRLCALTAERLGNAHTKNVALEASCGRIVLFLNDDVLPAPDLVELHWRAHAERPGRTAMVVGHSPFVRPSRGESVFDRLVDRTSMVFFYDRMISAQGEPLRGPEHDWGYRHAWSLNLSVPREAALAAGGFRPAIANCCYEDVEFAWRVGRITGAPVLFRPAARAEHDHRLTARAYLDREWRLGYSALGFATAAPECALDLFGRDILAEEELAYSRAFVERESRGEAAQMAVFAGLSDVPAGAVEGAHGEALLQGLYGQHLTLKRLAFRRGLLAAVAGERAPGLFLPSDGLKAEPPLARASAA